MERIWLKSYPDGVPAEIDVTQLRTLGQLIDDSCTRFADSVAYVQMGKALKFSEIDRLARNFSAYLQKTARLAKGERFAIMLPNVLQYPIAMFAALRSGLIVVNTNPLYTAPELEHQLIDSGATAILVLENFAHVVQQVLPRTGSHRRRPTRRTSRRYSSGRTPAPCRGTEARVAQSYHRQARRAAYRLPVVRGSFRR